MRSSPFHTSLHRPQLLLGIERKAFGILVLAASFAFVAQSFWGFPVLLVLYLLCKWLTKRDEQFIGVTLQYLNEDHVYDNLVRPADFVQRPKGWGKGLPL